MQAWIQSNLISLLALILGPLLAYIFSRRKETADIKKTDAETKKTDAETQNLLIESSETVVTKWEQYSKKQDDIIQKQNDKIQSLESRIVELEDCVINRITMQNQIDELSIKLIKLRNAFQYLINEVKGQHPDAVKIAREMLGE